MDPQFIVCLRKPLLTENGEGFTVRKRGALLSGLYAARSIRNPSNMVSTSTSGMDTVIGSVVELMDEARAG